MKILFYILAGVLGGVLAGMGMGGGTLTMPILVLLLGVGQLTAQYANLLAFLPSGASALALHVKNGLVDGEPLPYLLIPSALACGASSYFAVGLEAELLKKLFGGFLIAVAVCSLTVKTVKKR